MKRLMVAAFTAAMMLSGSAFAGDREITSTGELTGAVMPSAGAWIGAVSKSADARFLASKITDTRSAKDYAFSTGVSEEQGSFRLGVLLADLKVALKAGDAEKATGVSQAFSAELAQLGAPASLLKAVIAMNDGIRNGISLEAIWRASMPVLEPFVEEFIEKEGKIVYLRLGEWTEATRLAAMAAEEGKAEIISGLLKNANPAGYFLDELKSAKIARGAVDALKTLSELRARETIGSREVKQAIEATTTLLKVMG